MNKNLFISVIIFQHWKNSVNTEKMHCLTKRNRYFIIPHTNLIKHRQQIFSRYSIVGLEKCWKQIKSPMVMADLFSSSTGGAHKEISPPHTPCPRSKSNSSPRALESWLWRTKSWAGWDKCLSVRSPPRFTASCLCVWSPQCAQLLADVAGTDVRHTACEPWCACTCVRMCARGKWATGEEISSH